ncbi:MAG: hypothetical protein JRH08_05945 [Deltaproteobacteria bacterium]|nr:hypothetical protein [Deltaproteobacteria bacterium]MBW1927851.1 hypothetical protein [Deltaproteobacteria bacterium]MBW2026212.1 hypothetical protein [Deltaproteobacteria bacterium]MBW2125237.1 hypothetical protein [Deltaproteobacteria bacterium]
MNDINLEELKQKYLDLGGDPATLEEVSPDILQTLVDAREEAQRLIERHKTDLYVAELNKPVPEEEKPNINEAITKLRKIREREVDFNDPARPLKRNLEIDFTNAIREYFGLERLPFEYSDADLEVLLELDQWTIGPTCREFLNNQNEMRKQDYRQRMQKILFVRHSQKERERKEQKKLNEIVNKFEHLRHVPGKIKMQDGKPVISNEYQEWRENIKEFRHLLQIEKKYIDSILKEFPNTETKQKYAPFFKIFNEINDLCDREGI